MGYNRHHAIIVSSWSDEHIETAHALARIFCRAVSGIVNSRSEGVRSFFIPPDGSKEGWEDSNDGDHERETFIASISREKLYLKWVEVQYGDDNKETKIVNYGPKE